MNRQKTLSLTTVLSTWFGIFYSFVGAILFLMTLNATSNVCLNWNFNTISKEYLDAFCFGINEIIRGTYDSYLMCGIILNIFLFSISQIVEIKKGKYSIKSIIPLTFSLVISIILFHIRCRKSFL